MDVVTHTLVATAVGMAAYDRWRGTVSPHVSVTQATLGVIVAANLPSLELILEPISPAASVRALYGAGHSLFTLPLIELLFAWLLARKLKNFKVALAIAGLGGASHLALDLVSGPGVRLFWPISSQFYGIRLLARYDLFTLAILLIALVGPRLLSIVNQDIGAKAVSPQRPARVGLIALGVLLVLRFGLMTGIESRVETTAGPAPTLEPSAITPWTWYQVADEGSAYTVTELTPWGYGVSFRLRKAQSNRAFETAADTPLGQAFLALAQFPQYSLERGDRGMLVRIRDLRFYTPGGDAREYSVEIEVTPQLEVVAQRARM